MHWLSAACALVLGFVLTPAVAAPQRASDAVARLGPSIERIARLHAQAGQGVMAQRSRRALAEATRDFDATVKDAIQSAPGAEARENYVLLAMVWHDYRDWLQRPASRDSARKLRERTEEIGWVAAKGLRLVGESSRGALGAGALRASQAALASQRIAKAYLWRRWDMRDEALDRELRESRENLPRALEALAATQALSADSLAQVESARTQWRFLDDAARQLDAAAANPRALEFACKAADHIFEAMERVISRPD